MALPSLFRGLQFYLTRTLSPHDAAELSRIIEQHGGVVSASPAGSTQLVDYDLLDSRRQEWVSTEYIVDSVASGTLQDPTRYSGLLFTGRSSSTDDGGGGKRKVAYSVEDDARMLHFAKLRGWQSMHSVPQSAWVLAAHEKVTHHSAQSMHEHFRKQLRTKTPKEQRDILAKAAGLIRAQLKAVRTPLSCVSGRQAVTPEQTTPTARADPTTPATSSPPGGRQRGGSRQQKRKWSTSSSVDTETSSSREEDDESKSGEAGGDRGVFFRSAWTELITDPLKRAYLQALFRSTPQPEAPSPDQASPTNTESVASDVPTEVLVQDDDRGDGEEQRPRETEVEFATDPETDEIIAGLQLETHQEMPCVVHALYYCSGDIGMAREFLKGASPSGMWSPDDELLLVSLLAEEGIDRSAVDAAVARGDFAAMRVPSDTDAILHRVKFLR
ncbi:hypothetical protein PF010_g41 [Phytophthora fragariae]|uniref:BRCT domain-containing protein n=1 Tax=Phytophthora fragariae TaxID=53985 RepID=A0A6G0M5A4_9STRA|nr:hypothetical protein PF010_g41 [Phytophthora fragariae]